MREKAEVRHFYEVELLFWDIIGQYNVEIELDHSSCFDWITKNDDGIVSIAPMKKAP